MSQVRNSAIEIREKIFSGITKQSPKEQWKTAIFFCGEQMKKIRALNSTGFHEWRMCRDILNREFGKIFIEPKLQAKKDEEDAEVQRQVDISIGN